MARTFGATTDRLTSSSTTIAPASAGSLAFWFSPGFNSGDSTRRNLFRVFMNTSNQQEFGMVRAEDNIIYVGWIDIAVDFDEIALADTGLFASGTYAHWCLTWSDSANTMELFRNGSSIATRTDPLVTYSAGTGYSYCIGNLPSGANVDCRGTMAEYAQWDSVLSADDVSALADGFSPLLVSPATLNLYVPLIGKTSPESEIINNAAFTVSGTSTATHPPIIRPQSPYYPSFTPAAPPSPSYAPSNIIWF